ncbi:MAG: NAD(P)-dependent oxidoreductase [Thermodesulfovibrionia bacterium]|nr:NAD(P)-dependent oxidoreductase [Thermodesulfovibrionia bacterium]
MKALITGATGFIGSHLVDELFKRGYKVTCLVRKTSDITWLEGLDIEIIEGDCSVQHSLDQCVKGQDYIFHLAGLTKTHYKDNFYSVNTKGTENIIEAVKQFNPEIKRFVYLSSLSAFGPKNIDSIPNENNTPHPVSDYGMSKLMSEATILKYSTLIPVSILRPSAVYGPRDKEFFLFFKFIKKGVFPYWGNGYTSLIYVDDLINALLLTIENEKAVGNIYFISDDVIYTNNEIIKEIASALNVKVFKIKIPKPMLPTISFFSEGISKITGTNTMINRDKIKEIIHTEWVCDITKAKNDLSFEPKIGIKKGIQWTADWYRIHKWL